MTWQAVSGMRFKEVGTYAFVRRADGRATWQPSLLQPIAVQQYLTYEAHALELHSRLGSLGPSW